MHTSRGGMNGAPGQTERSFGMTVGGALAAASALAWWRSRPILFALLAVVGGLLLAGGLVSPRALRIPHRAWWRASQALGWVNSRILLTAVFFLVLTPTGLLLRLAGRSPFRLPDVDTSWWPARRRDASHFEHLF